MHKIRIGDIFVDARPPHRRWQVAMKSNDVFELKCLERPNVSRFHSADKLLDTLLYWREAEKR